MADPMVPPSNPAILTRSYFRFGTGGLGSTFARAFRAYPRADNPATVNRLAGFEALGRHDSRHAKICNQ
jgi:hypothetical protein